MIIMADKSNADSASIDMHYPHSVTLPSLQTMATVQKNPTKKRVRFDLAPSETIHDIASSTVVGVEINYYIDTNLWFSAQELQQIRARESMFIKLNRRYCEHYVQSVSSLFTKARQNISEQSSGDSLANNDNHVSPTVLSLICQSPARGLERDVIPRFRLRRKEVIQKFLTLQAKLLIKEALLSTEEYECQQHALSLHYEKLARPSARLAQWLAVGDAHATRVEGLSGEKRP
ncbi:expressed unknown protein [Seminavis robusta]|uniref:Uncharacterized protein n=1 Tax=Seminavis robusta TaxID=568900 RepID=A0A9N8HD73_9STRA|nr:expressed unknown protein [Seminavis robusta]|eukprot:Sro248_g098400.1 n/a (232) ;mRNA; r:60079-60774